MVTYSLLFALGADPDYLRGVLSAKTVEMTGKVIKLTAENRANCYLKGVGVDRLYTIQINV